MATYTEANELLREAQEADPSAPHHLLSTRVRTADALKHRLDSMVAHAKDGLSRMDRLMAVCEDAQETALARLKSFAPSQSALDVGGDEEELEALWGRGLAEAQAERDAADSQLKRARKEFGGVLAAAEAAAEEWGAAKESLAKALDKAAATKEKEGKGEGMGSMEAAVKEAEYLKVSALEALAASSSKVQAAEEEAFRAVQAESAAAERSLAEAKERVDVAKKRLAEAQESGKAITRGLREAEAAVIEAEAMLEASRSADGAHCRGVSSGVAVLTGTREGERKEGGKGERAC